MRLAFLLWFGLGALSLSGHAASYTLFDPGTHEPVSGYAQVVQRLHPGDSISFSNGKIVRLGPLLGTGNTTTIYAIEGSPELALRIPKQSGPFKQGFTYPDLIDSFVDGKKILEKYSIPSVKIHDSLRGEYAIVDRLDPKLTFYRFIHDPKLSKGLHARMQRDFIEFARKTAPLRQIGDFNPDQLFYDETKRQWALLDWTHTHAEIAFKEQSETSLRQTAHLLFKRGLVTTNDSHFFGNYAVATKKADGSIAWVARKPAYAWIANLANQVHAAILDERLKIYREKVLGLPPRTRGPCRSAFLRFLFGS